MSVGHRKSRRKEDENTNQGLNLIEGKCHNILSNKNNQDRRGLSTGE